MSGTIQIEHQAEFHRAHVSQLLDELRARATPGEVVDQFLGWKDGREIAQVFGHQVRNNPLPLTLIGAGIAWLMAGDAIRGRRPAAANSDRTRDTASNISDAAQSALDNARDKASDLAGSAQAAMGHARQTVSDSSAGVSARAASAWQKSSGIAHNTTDTLRRTGSRLNSAARDQPLLVSGIGMALGLALGAILPVSDFENEMLGKQADALKAKAGDLAREGYEQAKDVAGRRFDRTVDAATDEMEKQGPGSGSGHHSTESETPPGTVRSTDGKDGGFGSSAYPITECRQAAR